MTFLKIFLLSTVLLRDPATGKRGQRMNRMQHLNLKTKGFILIEGRSKNYVQIN